MPASAQPSGTATCSGASSSGTAAVAASLPPGRAIDLGCGEGGDALWLAEQGWRVTAVDISPTAIARGAALAASSPVGDRISWVAADLADWIERAAVGSVDLVTASFLHSTVELPRTRILRGAAALIAPGGHLLVVSHGAAPPWHQPDAHEHAAQRPVLLSPEEELVELALPISDWTTVLAESRMRQATGPDGQAAELEDGVVLLRRR